MKKVLIITAAWLALSCPSFSQHVNDALFSLFGQLPPSMDNEDLIKIKDGDNKISFVHYKTLGVVSDDHEVFPIGKVIVGKTIHLFYADVKYGYGSNPDDYLIDISGLAFDMETGQPVPSGVSFYLGMVGKDNLMRATTFRVNKDIITFTITSTDENGKKTVETSNYKMTAKDLEYIFSL